MEIGGWSREVSDIDVVLLVGVEPIRRPEHWEHCDDPDVYLKDAKHPFDL